jgi:hypothetical protein
LAACPIALWSGDLAAAERYAVMLIGDSTRHGLARWQVFGLCYQAMLVMRRRGRQWIASAAGGV